MGKLSKKKKPMFLDLVIRDIRGLKDDELKQYSCAITEEYYKRFRKSFNWHEYKKELAAIDS